MDSTETEHEIPGDPMLRPLTPNTTFMSRLAGSTSRLPWLLVLLTMLCAQAILLGGCGDDDDPVVVMA
ncbi:hypothetical protein DRQ50_07770, partial [bacterium]